MPRPDDGGGAGGTLGLARVARRHRAGPARARRRRAARTLPADREPRAARGGMVRSRAAGAHPSPHARAAAHGEIEPVSAADLMRFLFRWQHVQPGTQSARARTGCSRSSASSKGIELPARAWESQVLPARVSGYDPDDLEHLCLAGAVAWGRLRAAAPPRRRGRCARARTAPRRSPSCCASDLPWLLAPAAEPRRAVGRRARGARAPACAAAHRSPPTSRAAAGCCPGGRRGRAVDAGGARPRHRRRRRRPASADRFAGASRRARRLRMLGGAAPAGCRPAAGRCCARASTTRSNPTPSAARASGSRAGAW